MKAALFVSALMLVVLKGATCWRRYSIIRGDA